MFTYEYPRPAVTVDLVVMCPTIGIPRFLAVQRGKEPYKGMWALPGGFLNEDETTLDAAIRELREETGYVLDQLVYHPRLLGVYDRPDRDPRCRVISVAYLVIVSGMKEVAGADDAVNADWLPMNSIAKLAFDHEEIIIDALRKSKLAL